MKTFQKFYKFKILLTGYQILLENLFLFPAAFEKARENRNNSCLKNNEILQIVDKIKRILRWAFSPKSGAALPFRGKPDDTAPIAKFKKICIM